MNFIVLGIGNILYYDEGAGVHFCNYLREKYEFFGAHSIKFIDGGTLANLLIPTISECDELIVIDCISADGGAIGDVYFFPYSAMPRQISWSGSAHEIEMLQTLQFMELYGDMPKTHILGVIPKRIEPMSCALSCEILNSIGLMENAILTYLRGCGFEISQRKNVNLSEIISNAFKEQN